MRKLAFRARMVAVFAWAYIGLIVIYLCAGFYFNFVHTAPAGLVTDGSAMPTLPIWMAIFGLSSVLSFLAILCLAIAAMFWIYRAHANLAAQTTELEYTPGWAVGSYFVPFVNLVVPLRAMRELYNRSHGEVAELAQSSESDVGAWWTAYLVSLLVTSMLALKILIDDLTNLVFLTPAWMEFTMNAFATLLGALAAYLLTRIVRNITAAQSDALHIGSTFE